MPKLFLIPIPISDHDPVSQLSPQVPEIIKSLDLFLVENARTARRFISSLNLGITIEDLRFDVLDKRTEIEDLYHFMEPLRNGKDIGIMSESGCPGIADPGSLAVSYAHEIGAEVVPLVGPSSITLALMASGLNGQHFSFHGYLPIDERDRQKVIKNMESESRKHNQTQIFIETPYRNDKLLKTLVNTCFKETRLCIARDVLGKDQWIKNLPIEKWRGQKPKLNKIPVVFLLQS